MANLLSPLLFLACILLIVLGFNRGFDVSDEGFYVLLTVPFQENESGIINYDLFFKLFFRLTGISFSLVELRLIRLCSYFFSAFALTFFWKKHGNASFTDFQIFLLVTMGLFAGFAFLPPTLSYNSLTVVLACFWLFFVFSEISIRRKALFIGLVLGILVYVKVTVAIILFPISVFLMVKEMKISLVSIFLLIFPFLFLELIFWIFLGEFALHRLYTAIPLHSSRPDYAFNHILKSPLVGMGLVFLGMIPAVFVAKFRNHPPIIFYGLIFISFGIILSLIQFTHITEEWNHVVLILTSGFFAFLRSHYGWKRPFTQKEILLFFLPFILHFGSNVYWLRIGVHYWVFWVLLILIHLDQFSKLFTVLVSSVSLLLVFNGIWWHPFGQSELWKANEEWEYQPGKFIMLEDQQVKNLVLLKNQLDPNVKEILSVYRIPGIAFLLDKTIPKSPALWEKSQLERYFPDGYSDQPILYYPLEELPENFKGKRVLIDYSE